MSADGCERNVLKLKPPMVFDFDDAEHFMKTLEEILYEIEDYELEMEELSKVPSISTNTAQR